MSNENAIVGGWVVEPVVGGLPEKVATAFSTVMQMKGAEYAPLVYCAHQLVNGINHMLICKQTLVTKDQDIHVVKVVLNEEPNALQEGKKIEDAFSIVSIERIV